MTTPGFRPTHVVPGDGMPAWEAPDPARPTVPLDPLLPVQLLERSGDWGHVLCSNGWSAWVDGRLLVVVPQDPPLTGPPDATADPRPLLARAEQTLARYRAAVEELAVGTLDGEAFAARTRGLRAGIVVDGESVWLYDTEQGRWVYGEGVRQATYATDEGPRRAAPSPGPEGPAPTEVVAGDDGYTPTQVVAGDDGHAPTQVVTPDGP
ncbi:hypothetical protein RKD23_006884 [Streptomyces sp. SAI-170]|uniref:hypothetical protein n=1 Tax=Streptomyces sp. SAI-170 TaxID=3377729 RepID=UPI003C7E9827